ncbi:MAG: hypothetical protein NTY07_14305 [Bacteroidia bacterium]|nr:hypothetical protein [Bacteroidia bacterium]
MNIKNLLKQAIVVLNFPKVISNFIVYAKSIGMAMDGNSHFTAQAAKVTKLKTDTSVLDAAETALHTNPPTQTVEARNAALELVKDDLRALRNEVQNIADADPDNALDIIASAAMSVKDISAHGKQKNTATDGVDEGSVVLTGEGAGAHEWRISTDEINWTLLPASLTSKTTITDLISGGIYYFQNRRMLRNDEKSEWSQSVKFRLR